MPSAFVLILVIILHNLIATSVSQSILQLNLVCAMYIVNVMYNYRVHKARDKALWYPYQLMHV